MLNHAKVMRKLEQVANDLWVDEATDYREVYDLWQQAARDPTFLYRVKTENLPWSVPLWAGGLDDRIEVAPLREPYTLVAIDGSQIYPDRHQGVSCFVINIGTVVLTYTMPISQVQLGSEPYLFSYQDVSAGQEDSAVNLRRQELELSAGLQVAKGSKKLDETTPLLLLFDGTLIFWYLELQPDSLKERYIATYIGLLEELHKEQIPTASYISMPRSRELLYLLSLWVGDFDPACLEKYKHLTERQDAGLMCHMLQPRERSTIFENKSTITSHYSQAVAPYFFYVHNGIEIGRVEIPAWVAWDEKVLAFVAQAVMDQCAKGQGYPVGLAEAHEQAVIKGADRDFFYHLVNKLAIEHQRAITFSRKSMKKRSMGI